MEKSIQQRLAINVREAREAAGLGKARFCLSANITRPTLDQIEKGESNLTIDCLSRVAAALDMEPWELLR